LEEACASIVYSAPYLKLDELADLSQQIKFLYSNKRSINFIEEVQKDPTQVNPHILAHIELRPSVFEGELVYKLANIARELDFAYYPSYFRNCTLQEYCSKLKLTNPYG